jgi:hypothetical protein
MHNDDNNAGWADESAIARAVCVPTCARDRRWSGLGCARVLGVGVTPMSQPEASLTSHVQSSKLFHSRGVSYEITYHINDRMVRRRFPTRAAALDAMAEARRPAQPVWDTAGSGYEPGALLRSRGDPRAGGFVTLWERCGLRLGA